MSDQTILIIEDNALNALLVKDLLLLDGFNVLEAQDAESGIEIARRHPPDLILMDVQLPGMDGLQATQKLKQDSNLQSVPIIALTSHAMQGDEQRALQAGCSGYLTKPIDTRSFTAYIRKQLEPT